jgi:hypothetical protein
VIVLGRRTLFLSKECCQSTVLVEVEVVGRFLSKSEVLEWVVSKRTGKGRSTNKRIDERKSSFGVLVVLSSRLFVMKEGWF